MKAQSTALTLTSKELNSCSRSLKRATSPWACINAIRVCAASGHCGKDESF
ncbi:hypothetical protein D3C78_1757960 [compost metagenome]